MSKTMTIQELNKFEKLLAMTNSSNDAEALVAIRKANRMLAEARITWKELLSKQVTQEGDGMEAGSAAPDINTATDNHIQLCLDTLRGVNLGDFSNFIIDLDRVWKQNKYLTPGQRKPLFDAYKRFKEKNR